jgi:circadian clock protein KaiB
MKRTAAKASRMVPARAKRVIQRAPARLKRKTGTAKRRLLREAKDASPEHYLLRLYVTGMTPTSIEAIERVRSVCDEYLAARYKLEVIDLYQVPALARDHQIIATPTLIKELPRPLRRYIGDLSTVEKVLFGLDIMRRT